MSETAHNHETAVNLVAAFYTFVDLPDYRAHGGPLKQRCEKATAYLREWGFGNVYHLEGGHSAAGH